PRWHPAPRPAPALPPPHGRVDRAVGSTPAHHQHVTGGRTVDRGGRDLLAHPPDFLGTGAAHVVVVFRIVGDVARDVLLLETADAVLESGGAGSDPRPRQRGGISQVREKPFLFGPELHVDGRQRGRIGDEPRLRAVG